MRHRAIRGSVAATGAFLRRLPLFVSRSPRTPLRVLGVMALDTLHVLRASRPLPGTTARDLAAMLDLLGCANAAWDRKAASQSEFLTLRRELDRAGLQTLLDTYLGRLRALESTRPGVGGGAPRFEEARVYREAVARLSFATAMVVALELPSIDAAMAAIEEDADFATLARILLQCQIVDDVMDYREDLAAALPSFLTATASPADAVPLVAATVRSYGATVTTRSGRAVFPLRVALAIVTAIAHAIVLAARMRFRRSPADRSALAAR